MVSFGGLFSILHFPSRVFSQAHPAGSEQFPWFGQCGWTTHTSQVGPDQPAKQMHSPGREQYPFFKLQPCAQLEFLTFSK